jgi:hypothetical protein
MTVGPQLNCITTFNLITIFSLFSLRVIGWVSVQQLPHLNTITAAPPRINPSLASQRPIILFPSPVSVTILGHALSQRNT